MLSKASKRVIGVAAIVGGVLVIALGISQPNPFRATTSYWAEFTSVQGLGAIGRDIRVAGVNVGEIGAVERDGDNAVVELIMDEPIPLHVDARADMRPHTLFEGSSFIELSPGSPSAPPLEPEETISIERTSNYVTLDEALRVLRPEIRESLGDLAETGSKTLRGQAIEGIQATLRNSPELSARIKGPARALQGSSGRELNGAISGMAKTVTAVASQEEQLIPLAQRLNRTAAALTIDGGQPLDATLATLPGALRELNDGAPELTALIDRIDRLAAEANPALPDLTEAVAETTPLLRRSIPVLGKVTPVIGDLRKISGRLAEASPTLAKLVRTLDPVTKVFGESVLPVLTQPSRRGPPTYEQLLATFTDADAVFRQYQTESQNPLGGGHLWNIGTYIEPSSPLAPLEEGLGGGSATSCADVRQVNVAAARDMEAAGLCQ